MKFAELSFDCLESVLECLPLTDLLNASDTSKRLKKAAQLVYDRKHRKKNVKFDNISINPHPLNKIEIKFNALVIRDFKIALQLLRCVGRYVTELHILFLRIRLNKLEIAGQWKRDRWLITYVNKYCVENLKHLLIYPSHLYPSNLMRHFVKPFPNVHVFTNYDYNFTENVRLDKLFPNLQETRSYYRKNLSFFSVNTIHFPNIKKFLVAEVEVIDTPLQPNMVTSFLQLNPQITHLSLTSENLRRSNLNMDLIRDSVEYLQNVVDLILGLNPLSLTEDNDQIIRMKSVKMFRIRFDRLEALPQRFLPFEFEQLMMVRISFPKEEFRDSCQEEFFTFIEKHPNISTLHIRNIRSSDINWSRLASGLPVLAKFDLCDCSFSVDEIFELLPKFRMLKIFIFKLDGDVYSLSNPLRNAWDTQYCPDNKWVRMTPRYSRCNSNNQE